MNKYTLWYNTIIEQARNRITDVYTESHHVQPRSLGGTDNKDNLVDLTAREHFVCHWLLSKMYTGEAKAKMIYALNGMKRGNEFTQRYNTKITARVYEKLKKEFSRVHSATMKGTAPVNKGSSMTEEQKAKIRATKAANPTKRSAEAIAKTVAKQTGQKRSEETKLKMSLAAKGKLKGPMSEENKLKISQGSKGKTKREGHGDRIKATVAAQLAAGTHYTQQPKLTCPHCGVQANKARYNGYHGDKCKHRHGTNCSVLKA
jgi:hypothetical protein